MNILFDGPYQSTPKAGVLLYFNLLARELSNSNIIYFSRTLSSKCDWKGISTPRFKHYRPHKLFFYLEYIWFKFFGPNHFDFVHTIEYSLTPTGKYFLKKGAKHVITIYDLIHEIFGADPSLYNRISRENFYKDCDGFIFISNSTKKDFNKFYPALESCKSSIIYLASKFLHSNISLHSDLDPNFLYVGSREGYKNFSLALNIFELILTKESNAKLVVCGAAPNKNEKMETNKFRKSLEWVVFPNDDELSIIYQNSFALLYTTSYEGFGLPLLEAMSNGCIPVARNHSSIPEVMGNGGIYLDNDNINQIVKDLIKIFQDTQKHKFVLKEGFNQASKFTWSKTASETINFYRTLIER